MAGVTIEVVKRINFDKKAWDMMKKLSEISTTRREQMTDAVMANIIRHDNIDTGTLIDNLKTEKQLDPKEMSIETSSDVSSHPEGHRGYAPLLEYGTGRTRPYPNFIPVLDTITPLVMKDLGDIDL